MMDKKFRIPRIWSNKELKKFAHLFKGDIINVSGWKDIDKEGKHYRDYFINADNYYISNYKKKQKGLQGFQNEIYLDLEKNLDKKLINRFDVVFNHTTLEHIYDFRKAFKNLCLVSKDIVILVVPFLQQMHGLGYPDYWRFSPLAIKKMFEENKMELLYLSFNNERRTSVYLFAIASKKSKRWKKIKKEFKYTCKKEEGDTFPNFVGCRAITN